MKQKVRYIHKPYDCRDAYEPGAELRTKRGHYLIVSCIYSPATKSSSIKLIPVAEK